jgi:hypothetical protein
MGDRDKKDEKSSEFSFERLVTSIPDAVAPVIGGCVAFGTTLAASTAAQKAIGVSTATNVVPSLLGFATVCAASLVSEQTAIVTHQLQRDPNKLSLGSITRGLKRKVSETSNAMVRSSSKFREGEKRKFKVPMHEVRV